MLYILIPSVQATFVRLSMGNEDTSPSARALLQQHGQPILNAIVIGITGVSPRSAIVNLAEVLSIFVSKLNEESKVWLRNAVYSVCNLIQGYIHRVNQSIACSRMLLLQTHGSLPRIRIYLSRPSRGTDDLRLCIPFGYRP